LEQVAIVEHPSLAKLAGGEKLFLNGLAEFKLKSLFLINVAEKKWSTRSPRAALGGAPNKPPVPNYPRFPYIIEYIVL
jgi:hypothetical protein